MSTDAPAARPPSEPADTGYRVLVADDDRTTRERLAALLRADGYAVELCEDGAEALSRVAQGGIDLVLLDVMMPRMSGTETCRLLKGMAGASFLPIILLTAKNDASSRVEGLRLGADDYVGKPFDEAELSARVAAMLRIKRLIGSLSEDRERLLKRAVHDDLTGLPNRRAFEARLLEERKRAERYHDPFACMLVDVAGPWVDRGSASFDRLIARGAGAIKRSVREGDVVARFGDAVFAALLPHTHFTGAIAAAERILRDVAAALGEPDMAASGVSIGAALYPSRDVRTPEGLLASAESALEEAQRAGGGNICVLQQRKYLYAPGAFGPGASAAARAEARAEARSEPPPLSTRRASTEPPSTGRHGGAGSGSGTEPPPGYRRRASDPPAVSGRRGSTVPPPPSAEGSSLREPEGRRG